MCVIALTHHHHHHHTHTPTPLDIQNSDLILSNFVFSLRKLWGSRYIRNGANTTPNTSSSSKSTQNKPFVLSYCFHAYLTESLLTLNFFFNPPLYTTVLPCNTEELVTTLRLGTGSTVGLAVLTTAITCQQSRTFLLQEQIAHKL
jgi:hypothetical protein